MSRLTNAILAEGTAYLGDFGSNTTLNPELGNSHGFIPSYKAYVSTAHHIRKNLIAVVINSPRGFNDLPEPQRWHAAFKAIIEEGSIRISGLNATLTVDNAETAYGSNEMFQDPTKVNRQRSTPTHTHVEKYGKPYNRFYTGWITYLIGHPDTGVPAISQIAGTQPADLLPDYIGATVLYFEPDATHTKVVEAWLCTNMRPNTAGPVEGSRDLQAPGQTIEFDVEFTALTQHGLGVKQFAQQIFDEILQTGLNPNRIEAFTNAIDADVKRGEYGYAEGVKRAQAETIA
jgi:hypothetical protein